MICINESIYCYYTLKKGNVLKGKKNFGIENKHHLTKSPIYYT